MSDSQTEIEERQQRFTALVDAVANYVMAGNYDAAQRANTAAIAYRTAMPTVVAQSGNSVTMDDSRLFKLAEEIRRARNARAGIQRATILFRRRGGRC